VNNHLTEISFFYISHVMSLIEFISVIFFNRVYIILAFYVIVFLLILTKSTI